MPADHLNHWAERLDEREAIESFLDWAQSQGLATIRFAYSRSDVLDHYHKIDRVQLEKARRELLARTREMETP